MLSKDQNQDVGENATAVQAGNDANVKVIHNYGVSYSEVRQIALDIYKANFYELAGAAKETARARAEEITEEFLKKLQEENPEGFLKAEEPDFQHGLLTIQKEYARTGDKELGDLLVDLLVDRSKQDKRNILQIVLNESLSIAPKLTDEQFSALSIIFLFKYTRDNRIGNHKDLGEYFDKHIFPFIGSLVTSSSCYQHLEFTGCGSIQMGEISLVEQISYVYQGQFMKGFDVSEIEAREITIGLDKRFFIYCLNDSSRIQVNANSIEILENKLDIAQVIPEDRVKILELFNIGKMSNDEIRQLCINLRPYMKNVFEVWSDSSMKSFTLTSVGIAIAHANVKRLIGNFADLSIWIN